VFEDVDGGLQVRDHTLGQDAEKIRDNSAKRTTNEHEWTRISAERRGSPAPPRREITDITDETDKRRSAGGIIVIPNTGSLRAGVEEYRFSLSESRSFFKPSAEKTFPI
jgi:hypothetical protein